MESTAADSVPDLAAQAVDGDSPPPGRRLITWLSCAACVIAFVGLLREPNPDWSTLADYGYLPPSAIWNGRYWALVTSVFVHATWLHLVFNVYWLWILGGTLERTIGSLRFLAFFIAAAFVSSGVEFAVAGTTGVGASGVVYAIFGFMWVAGEKVEVFKKAIPKQTVVVFLGWAVLCIVATLLKIRDVGNAAHISGLLFGAALAGLFSLKRRVPLMIASLSVLILAAVVPLFWAPWQAGWVAKQAYDAHGRHDYYSAVSWYQRGIDMGGDRVWALKNMTLAYASMDDKQKVQETLDRLREVDPKAAEQIEHTLGRSGTN